MKRHGDDEINILNVETLSSGDVTVDFAYYEYIDCHETNRKIYYPSTAPTYGVTYNAAPTYTFNDTASPINALYGSRISDDVPSIPVAANYNANISAVNNLPEQGKSVAEGSTGKDAGFVVYVTSINSVTRP